VWQLPAAKRGRDPAEQITALRERFRALIGDMKLLAMDFSAALAEESVPEESPSFESARPSAGGPPTIHPQPPTRVWD
jgi:hypothetical protein